MATSRVTSTKTYSASARGSAFVPVRCGVCGSDSYRPRMLSGEYRFVRCDGCGVTYQNPQPTPDSLRSRYGGEYFRYELDNERAFLELMLLGLADIGFDRLRGVEARGGFLDVGCATGMLLQHMKGQGWATRGVEICEESARYGREERGIDISVGTLEEIGLPSQAYRIVHLSHLIEHVREPRAFLKEVRRVVQPDGYAIITTPNIDGLQARILRGSWRSVIADHLYLFRPSTLACLLSSVGFRVARIVTWGGIAKGLAPAFIKRPVDQLAKRMGFGDVMMLLATPR